MAHTRGILAGLTFAVGVTALARPDAQMVPPRAPAVSGFDQTQAWLRMARTHTIGRVDDSARTVAAWSPATLQRVLDDLQLVRVLLVTASQQARMPGAGDSRNSSLYAELRGRRLQFDRLASLLGLPLDAPGGPFTPADLGVPDSPVRQAIARLMLQGALLQSDIGMAPPVELALPAGARATATAVQLRDGREVVVPNPTVHYAIGREAIAMVLPATIGSAIGRQWYHATLASMLSGRNYALLLPHLETARTILPADAYVWLMSGAAYENLAAPAVQVAVDAAGSSARIEAPVILLSRAEQMDRRALLLDPGLDEARLRLGRVLDLTGRHDEAMVMLLQAEAHLESPVLRYCANLFAGRAAEAMGQTDTARGAYERAMALFPRAQSPRLALSEMAWRSADQASALSGLRVLFVTGAGDRTTDPWWSYDVALSGDSEERVDDMRRVAAAVVAR